MKVILLLIFFFGIILTGMSMATTDFYFALKSQVEELFYSSLDRATNLNISYFGI